MSDEKRSDMKPDEGASSRHFTEDEPAENTEGHVIKGRPAKDDEPLGSETGTDGSEDSEGHAGKFRP